MQHLELTRDIAQRFNSLYGETFVMPETKLPAVGARIMGLDDPTAKMSKSAAGSGHAVALLDPPDRIRKTIMRATTDSNPAVDFETMGPGVQNLLSIFHAFSGLDDEQMPADFTGLRYGDLKKQVAEMVISKLEPIQARYREIAADAAMLDRVLRDGAEAVTPIANSDRRTGQGTYGRLYARSFTGRPRCFLVKAHGVHFRRLVGDFVGAVFLYGLNHIADNLGAFIGVQLAL